MSVDLREIFEELSRRRVFRGVGVYLVVAWVLLQLARGIAPDGAVRDLLIGLYLMGAVFAGLFSWLFRVTPGAFALEHVDENTPERTRFSRMLDRAVIVGLALILSVSVIQIALPGEPGRAEASRESGSASALFLPSQ